MRAVILVVTSALYGACGFELSPGAGDADGLDETDAPAGDADASDDGGSTPDSGTLPAPCPITYTNGYRLVTTGRTWLDAERACEQDLPGSTHLVVIDNEAERAVIATLVQGQPIGAWVGIVRDSGGSAPWTWRYVTGGVATYAPFEAAEPQNASGDQFVTGMRATSGHLYDWGIAILDSSVCECDRRAAVNADYDPQTN